MDWLEQLPQLTGLRALDVACGSGRFSARLAGRYREVLGVDRAEAIGRAQPHPGVSYRAMDAEALELPDASFDLAAISWALHHLANPTRVLLEMRRVLKPGGVLLIVEPIRAPQGNNQDLHTAAHQLMARADFARGLDHFPLYERLQVGSVIQGLGLEELGFHPVLTDPAERAWGPAECQAAAAPWIAKLEGLAADTAVAEGLRAEARELVERLRSEGLRTSPVMVTYGRVPVHAQAAQQVPVG